MIVPEAAWRLLEIISSSSHGHAHLIGQSAEYAKDLAKEGLLEATGESSWLVTDAGRRAVAERADALLRG